MQRLLTVGILVAAFASIGGVAAAATTDQDPVATEESTETGAPTLDQPRPSWYTDELRPRCSQPAPRASRSG